MPWALMPFLSQPEPGPPDPHPASWTPTEHIGPAEALGRHLFPTSVFRLQNLDVFSNHCPGLNMRQKSEILPHGKKSCGWRVAQRSV